jgi:hypothetical protein
MFRNVYYMHVLVLHFGRYRQNAEYRFEHLGHVVWWWFFFSYHLSQFLHWPISFLANSFEQYPHRLYSFTALLSLQYWHIIFFVLLLYGCLCLFG